MPRLLSINNYYYRRGGSEAVYFEHNQLFEAAGWEVVPFSMHNALNLPSPWSRHFVSDTAADQGSTLGKLARAATAIYSREAARRIREVLAEAHPDVAHAHNIYHHLSPSVLVELRRRNIPVVLTLHDLKLVCPAYKMHNRGAVCEQCRGGALRNVVKNRCIKNSAAMSALVWLESTLHQMLGLYRETVTRFVVPSRFFLAKFTEWGVDTRSFVHIPNSIDVNAFAPADGDSGESFVYIGRLVPEKGVETLIRAAAHAKVRLRIVGTGSEETALRTLAAELGGDVEFTGYLTGAPLRAAIASARAVVIPSEWYENAPISVMEASAMGRPVIGADIGGIPELIRPGETGFVFDSGSVESLAGVLIRVQRCSSSVLHNLGAAGREWMRAEFSPTAYRERMLALYSQIGVHF